MAAGVPVVASSWHYNAEIINDGVSGFICEPKNVDSLARVLDSASNNASVNQMKCFILEKAKEYTPENVLKDFIRNMEE